jgi:hypothetical protein
VIVSKYKIVFLNGAQDYQIDEKYVNLRTEDPSKPYLGNADLRQHEKEGHYPTEKTKIAIAAEKLQDLQMNCKQAFVGNTESKYL